MENLQVEKRSLKEKGCSYHYEVGAKKSPGVREDLHHPLLRRNSCEIRPAQ